MGRENAAEGLNRKNGRGGGMFGVKRDRERWKGKRDLGGENRTTRAGSGKGKKNPNFRSRERFVTLGGGGP